MSEPPHLRRILIIGIVLSVVATLLAVLVFAPGLQPGNDTTEASGQVIDNTVLLGIVTPIFVLMVVYFAYALIVFRQRGPEPEEGVAIHGDRRIQTTWLVTTSVISSCSWSSYGTVRLFDDGSGGGPTLRDQVAYNHCQAVVEEPRPVARQERDDHARRHSRVSEHGLRIVPLQLASRWQAGQRMAK